ncbi:MAG: energy-coupling factor ABC transporter ATP-binding protein [Chloroflexi bacterium]|nr:energy-coupling factor ABC transporter ATP-binding protein [Chloroflexota bacterium]
MSLALRGVGYRYPGVAVPALLDVDLHLGSGEVVGVTGASESGKTTLCLVVSGLAPRVVGGRIRGTITLDGESVDDWPMHRLAGRVGIGFQDPTSQLSQVAVTVFEEVAFGPMNLGVARDAIVERTWEALGTLRIEGLAERDPRRLSGGQQQLVAMAGLLAMRPAHLVLDEPTAQLDPAGTRLVAEAVERLAEGGASILITEQKTDLLASVADRVVVLRDGRFALDGPTDEVLADPRLIELGVREPAPLRLRRLAATAGVDPALLQPAADA